MRLVQKALRKLATNRVPTSVAQLVMWRVSGRLDWGDDPPQLSQDLGQLRYESVDRWPGSSWIVSRQLRGKKAAA